MPIGGLRAYFLAKKGLISTKTGHISEKSSLFYTAALRCVKRKMRPNSEKSEARTAKDLRTKMDKGECNVT